jgi:hypothetical protein
MFNDKSRYAGLRADTVTTPDGRKATAIRLRRLPPTAGDPYTVAQGDRLDILAQRRFADSTKFWHIADANSELEARRLVARVLDSFNLPRS